MSRETARAAARRTSEASRRGTQQEAPKAPAPKTRPPVLQANIPIEKDPEEVRRLEAEKRDENFRLRAFLKWGGVLGNAAVCPIVFSTLERLKAELVERGFDWRAEERGEVPSW